MGKAAPRPRNSRKSQTEISSRRPDVILDFLFDRGLFFIAIENIGDGPALKVSAKFDQKIKGLGGAKEITSLPLFRNIEFLAPHKSITTLVDSSTAYFRRREPKNITVRISYSDLDHHRYHVTVRHNLRIYEDISYVTSSPEQNSLPSINQIMNRKEG